MSHVAATRAAWYLSDPQDSGAQYLQSRHAYPFKKKTLQCREMHSPRISPKGWWTVLQPQTCLKFLPWGSIGVGKAEAKREESVPGLWPSSFYREGSTKEAELARQLPEYRQPVPLPVQG